MVSKLVRLTILLTSTVFAFTLVVLLGSNLYRKKEIVRVIQPSAAAKLGPELQSMKEDSVQSFPVAYNSTHLWSMRVADKEHYRIVNLVPCRDVFYHAHRGTGINETMNHCNEKTREEFSVESTLQAQQWIFNHQNPMNCQNKRFAIIHKYAWSGFGSTIHQIVWALATAIGNDRIAVYQKPGGWQYGSCEWSNPDCLFLPISNCSVPTQIDGTQVIRLAADIDHWYRPAYPSVFQKRSFNWYRSQLLFYLMRFNAKILAHIQNTVARDFVPPSIDFHRPYIAIYIRRSDKVNREMGRAFTLQEYFDLFNADARRAQISTVYINSEDDSVFSEFETVNKKYGGYYKLIRIKAEKNIVFMTLMGMDTNQRGKIVLEFLTDLYIEANADLHSGTLTSNWCRLVDEMRFVLGKMLPFYTPEHIYHSDV
ncbi:unnamed protein product [Adineta ricciae]|uniref:Alpha-(1,6)-fucosyltransferase N- and catalytic domain-containing protein n=1 Tax=Adineta ricciae TaxID=249248 RepID=A0A813RGI6_ADIRI|nr:unnamed protein product [Adineta ricciae]CAF1245934.1 unnamed protein product [Adineta ricciae]